MQELNQAMIEHLRSMAVAAESPATMLREILHGSPPEGLHTITLVQYMREAFRLTLAQASPIAGWASTGIPEMDDSRLNGLLWPEIVKNRPVWESLRVASSA